jgi:hypothetical protein
MLKNFKIFENKNMSKSGCQLEKQNSNKSIDLNHNKLQNNIQLNNSGFK